MVDPNGYSALVEPGNGCFTCDTSTVDPSGYSAHVRESSKGSSEGAKQVKPKQVTPKHAKAKRVKPKLVRRWGSAPQLFGVVETMIRSFVVETFVESLTLLCFFPLLVGDEVQSSRTQANSPKTPAGMYRGATPIIPKGYMWSCPRRSRSWSHNNLPRDSDPGFKRAPMSTGAPNKVRGREVGRIASV